MAPHVPLVVGYAHSTLNQLSIKLVQLFQHVTEPFSTLGGTPFCEAVMFFVMTDRDHAGRETLFLAALLFFLPLHDEEHPLSWFFFRKKKKNFMR